MADNMRLETLEPMSETFSASGVSTDITVEAVAPEMSEEAAAKAERLRVARSRRKRAVDVVLAAAALTFIAPLLAVVAVAIKMDSRGPVIFRQKRTGLDGRAFTIFKFRTMTVAEDGDRVVQAQQDDIRVTRVGKFLRRSSIDELPQLFNVVRGEMSLVGPRPHALAHDEEFATLEPTYERRFRSPPGITGLAQLAGERGPVSGAKDVRKRTKLDLAYQDNWSFRLDLWLLIKTPFVLLQHFVRKQSF